jgi:hypothetical protein
MATRTRDQDQLSAASKAWVRSFTDIMESRVVDLAARLESRGFSVTDVGDPTTIATKMMVAYLPERWELDDEVGPFLDTSGVRARLHVSRQRVHALAKQGGLLKATTSDGVSVYPAYQFDGDRIVHGLRDVLAPFSDADAWMVVTWFPTPDPELGDRSPIEALRDGDVSEAARVARSTAAAWRS